MAVNRQVLVPFPRAPHFFDLRPFRECVRLEPKSAWPSDGNSPFYEDPFDDPWCDDPAGKTAARLYGIKRVPGTGYRRTDGYRLLTGFLWRVMNALATGRRDLVFWYINSLSRRGLIEYGGYHEDEPLEHLIAEGAEPFWPRFVPAKRFMAWFVARTTRKRHA